VKHNSSDFQRRPAAFPIGVVRSGARRRTTATEENVSFRRATAALYSLRSIDPEESKNAGARVKLLLCLFFPVMRRGFSVDRPDGPEEKKPGRTSAAATGRPASQ
jgi:hypothetical protein